MADSELSILASLTYNKQQAASAGASMGADASRAFNAAFKPLDASSFSKQLSDPKKQFNQLTEASADFGDSLERGLRRIVALSAASTALFGIVKVFKESLVAARELEKSLKDINVVLNLPSDQLEKFGNSLFNVAKNTKQAFSEVTKSAVEFARQGLGVEETLKRTEAALILVNLAGLDSVKSTEAITAAINSFSKENLRAIDVVNKLVAVDAKFAVSSADLAEAITRVGSVSQDVGVDFNRLVAIVTSAQQVTQRGGAVIGNALKTIFQRLQTAETLDGLTQLGIQVREVDEATQKFTGDLVPADRILAQIKDKFKDLTQEERAHVSQLVAGNLQGNIFRGVLEGLSFQTEAYKTALNSSDEAIKRNAALLETQDAKLKQVGLTFQQVGANIGKVGFGDAISSSLDALNGKGGAGLFGDILKNLSGQGGDVGNEFGRIFIKSFSDIILGPGLIAVAGIGLKIAQTLGGFLKSNIKQVFPGANQFQPRDISTQEQITKFLDRNIVQIQQINASSDSEAAKQKQILAIFEQQNAALAKQQSLYQSTGTAILRNQKPGRTLNFADGVTDAFIREKNAISKRVGGASSSAKPVFLPNFPTSTGKGAVANTDEYIVPNFSGTGKPAIFNREMVQNYGLPENAVKISGNVQNYPVGTLLGRGIEGSFFKLRGGVGVKRFKDPTSSRTQTSINNEFDAATSFNTLVQKKELPSYVGSPEILGTKERSLRAGRIGKSVVAGDTLDKFIDKNSNEFGFDRVKAATKELTGNIRESAALKKVNLRDLNAGNVIINDKFADGLKSALRSGKSIRFKSLFEELGRQGGKASVVDFGFSSVSSRSRGYVPNAAGGSFVNVAKRLAKFPNPDFRTMRMVAGKDYERIARISYLPEKQAIGENPDPETKNAFNLFKQLTQGKSVPSYSQGFVPNAADPLLPLGPIFQEAINKKLQEFARQTTSKLLKSIDFSLVAQKTSSPLLLSQSAVSRPAPKPLNLVPLEQTIKQLATKGLSNTLSGPFSRPSAIQPRISIPSPFQRPSFPLSTSSGSLVQPQQFTAGQFTQANSSLLDSKNKSLGKFSSIIDKSFENATKRLGSETVASSQAIQNLKNSAEKLSKSFNEGNVSQRDFFTQTKKLRSAISIETKLKEAQVAESKISERREARKGSFQNAAFLGAFALPIAAEFAGSAATGGIQNRVDREKAQRGFSTAGQGLGTAALLGQFALSAGPVAGPLLGIAALGTAAFSIAKGIKEGTQESAEDTAARLDDRVNTFNQSLDSANKALADAFKLRGAIDEGVSAQRLPGFREQALRSSTGVGDSILRRQIKEEVLSDRPDTERLTKAFEDFSKRQEQSFTTSSENVNSVLSGVFSDLTTKGPTLSQRIGTNPFDTKTLNSLRGREGLSEQSSIGLSKLAQSILSKASTDAEKTKIIENQTKKTDSFLKTLPTGGIKDFTTKESDLASFQGRNLRTEQQTLRTNIATSIRQALPEEAFDKKAQEQLDVIANSSDITKVNDAILGFKTIIESLGKDFKAAEDAGKKLEEQQKKDIQLIDLRVKFAESARRIETSFLTRSGERDVRNIRLRGGQQGELDLAQIRGAPQASLEAKAVENALKNIVTDRSDREFDITRNLSQQLSGVINKNPVDIATNAAFGEASGKSIEELLSKLENTSSLKEFNEVLDSFSKLTGTTPEINRIKEALKEVGASSKNATIELNNFSKAQTATIESQDFNRLRKGAALPFSLEGAAQRQGLTDISRGVGSRTFDQAFSTDPRTAVAANEKILAGARELAQLFVQSGEKIPEKLQETIEKAETRLSSSSAQFIKDRFLDLAPEFGVTQQDANRLIDKNKSFSDFSPTSNPLEGLQEVIDDMAIAIQPLTEGINLKYGGATIPIEGNLSLTLNDTQISSLSQTILSQLSEQIGAQIIQVQSTLNSNSENLKIINSELNIVVPPLKF